MIGLLGYRPCHQLPLAVLQTVKELSRMELDTQLWSDMELLCGFKGTAACSGKLDLALPAGLVCSRPTNRN